MLQPDGTVLSSCVRAFDLVKRHPRLVSIDSLGFGRGSKYVPEQLLNIFIGPFAVARNGRAKGPMPFTERGPRCAPGFIWGMNGRSFLEWGRVVALPVLLKPE